MRAPTDRSPPTNPDQRGRQLPVARDGARTSRGAEPAPPFTTGNWRRWSPLEASHRGSRGDIPMTEPHSVTRAVTGAPEKTLTFETGRAARPARGGRRRPPGG